MTSSPVYLAENQPVTIARRVKINRVRISPGKSHDWIPTGALQYCEVIQGNVGRSINHTPFPTVSPGGIFVVQPGLVCTAHGEEAILSCHTELIHGFSNLSPELLNMVLNELFMDKIKGRVALDNLSQTCRKLRAMVLPILHWRVSVPSTRQEPQSKSHARRALLRYITKQQQEQVHNSNNQDKSQDHCVPTCAVHVRQVLFHAYKWNTRKPSPYSRLIEAVLSNFAHAEVVHFEQLPFFTESMANSIQSMADLRALHLNLSAWKPGKELGAIESLAEVKPLERFAYMSPVILWNQPAKPNHDVIESILRKSQETLTSLDMSKREFIEHSPESPANVSQKYIFNSLLSLRLSSFCGVDEACMRSISRAVNLIGLKDLVLTGVDDTCGAFGAHLETLFRSEHRTINLRRLVLQKTRPSFNPNDRLPIGDAESTYKFLTTFNTLRELYLRYFYLPQGSEDNSIPGSLLQGILAHTNLTILQISSFNFRPGFRRFFINVSTLEKIINGLSHLEYVQLLTTGDPTALGKALSQGKNLRTIMLDHDTDHSFKIVDQVLQGFLNARSWPSHDSWEDQYRLRRLDIHPQQWALASRYTGENGEFVSYEDRNVWRFPVENERKLQFALIPMDFNHCEYLAERVNGDV